MIEVVDNVGSHHNRSVRDAYERAGWLLAFLPPNMTHLLQPMDVAVNGPVKSRLRSMRIDLQFDYFQQFRAEYYQAKARGEQLPKFTPPVPLLEDGLRVCLGMRDCLFAEAKFQQALARTFVKVGLKQTEANGLCGAH